MRLILGVLSLLAAVAIVGVLAKKQLGAAAAPSPGPQAAPQQQVRQVQQAVQESLQQARPMPDDVK